MLINVKPVVFAGHSTRSGNEHRACLILKFNGKFKMLTTSTATGLEVYKATDSVVWLDKKKFGLIEDSFISWGFSWSDWKPQTFKHECKVKSAQMDLDVLMRAWRNYRTKDIAGKKYFYSNPYNERFNISYKERVTDFVR